MSTEERNILKRGKKKQGDSLINRMFMSAFATAIISSASQLGASFFDGVITSMGLGAGALAAVGIAAPCFSIVSFFSACISNGMRAMCTSNLGKGKNEKVNRVFSEAVMIAFFISIIIMALMLIFTDGFARLLGATGDAAALEGDVSQYITGFAFGVPALMLTVVFSTALQIDDGGKLVKKASYLSIAVNFTGDVLAVVCGFGIKGIALTTALSCYVSAGCMCIHLFSKKTKLKFMLTRLVKTDVLKMISLGSDKLVNSVINVLRPVLFNRMVIFFGGSIAMTVLSARNNLSGLCEIASGGIGIAVAISIGFFFGEKNREDIHRIGRKAQRLSLCIMIPVGIALIIFAVPIAKFYMNGENPEAIKLLSFALICLGIRMPLGTLNYAYMQYLQTTHQMMSARKMTILLNFIYILLAGFILGSFFGAYGIMAAFPVADGTVILTLYIKYCIKTHSMRPTGDDYLNLSENQLVQPDDILEFSVIGEADREKISMDFSVFAERHSVDEGKRKVFQECIGNGIDRLFTKAAEGGVENVKIDIRVVITNSGENSIRFRYPNTIRRIETEMPDGITATSTNTLGIENTVIQFDMGRDSLLR